MKRFRAATVGIGVAVTVYGGYVLVRTLSRLLYAAAWVVESIATLGVAIVLGYVAYRVLWGVSDDPRRH
ncbi:MAG: hypothetical protein ACQETB_01560 [Halobacteriota archaeon]